jgi:hypothetical protein
VCTSAVDLPQQCGQTSLGFKAGGMMRLNEIAAGIGLLGMVGCGDGAEEDLVSTNQSSTSADRLNGSTSAIGELPIASLEFENGNVLEFYDFVHGVMVVERGRAYTRPVFRGGSEHAGQLEQIWRRLSPDTPVPSALIELQGRMTEESDPSANTNDSDAPGVEAVAEPDIGGWSPVQTKAPQGCNNGCCDYQWLATFAECQGGWDYSWFLYNYGATWANVDDIILYGGLVCAATGTSTFRVNIEGSGGVWSVAQGTWNSYFWIAAFKPVICAGYCGKNLRSSVNTQSSQHLHTYCGTIAYD